MFYEHIPIFFSEAKKDRTEKYEVRGSQILNKVEEMFPCLTCVNFFLNLSSV